MWETEKVGTTWAEELPLAWTRSRSPASERRSYRKGQKPRAWQGMMLGHWGEGQRGQAESRGDAGKEEGGDQGPANPLTSLSFHLPVWVGFCFLYRKYLCVGCLGTSRRNKLCILSIRPLFWFSYFYFLFAFCFLFIV